MMTTASPQNISKSSNNWASTCESKSSMRMSLNERSEWKTNEYARWVNKTSDVVSWVRNILGWGRRHHFLYYLFHYVLLKHQFTLNNLLGHHFLPLNISTPTKYVNNCRWIRLFLIWTSFFNPPTTNNSTLFDGHIQWLFRLRASFKQDPSRIWWRYRRLLRKVLLYS